MLQTPIEPNPPDATHSKPRVRRRWWLWLVVPLVVAILAGAGWLGYSWMRVNDSIARVPVEGLATDEPPEATAPKTTESTSDETGTSASNEAEFEIDPNAVAAHPDARFYLLLGTDSRDGHPFAADQGLTGPGRADVIALIRTLPGRSPAVLSIPRDFRVRLAGSSRYVKINAGHSTRGLSTMVRTITERLGIPIHHVAKVNFIGLERTVDAIGGVELCMEHAERDTMSGLDITAGCQEVDGPKALAYARSRHAEQFVDGTWVADQSADFGRIRRQHNLLLALAHRISSPTTLARLPQLAASLEGSVVVDDGFGVDEMIGLGTEFGPLVDATSFSTVTGRSGTSGGIYYLWPTSDSQTIVDNFKSGG